MEIQFKKVRNVESPQFGTNGSAGIDFFIPNDFGPFELGPQKSILIPSGIKCKIPTGYCLLAVNKSGIATKKLFQVGACLVDSDYCGEIHIHLVNIGDKPQIIGPGEKIIQFMFIQNPQVKLVENNELVFDKTERGEGGFGSTNKPNIQLNKTTLYVVRQNPTAQSVRMDGLYKRTFFRDIDGNQYILDICKYSPNFLKLRVGDVITNVDVFEKNNKKYVRGESKALYLGKFEDLKHLFVKQEKQIKGIII